MNFKFLNLLWFFLFLSATAFCGSEPSISRGPSNQPPICEDFAKFTCQHKVSILAEKNYNEFLNKVQNRYLEILDAELVKYPLSELLAKTGLKKPEECASEKISENCHTALKRELDESASEIQKYFLGKESKYSDPNVPRPTLLFELFETNAHQVSQQVMAEHEDDILRMERLFKNVREALVNKISSQTSEPMTTELLKRIKSVKFDSKLCASSNYSADYTLTAPAVYENKPHSFTVCPQIIVGGLNDTQLSIIIGHEITHSIDSCVLVQTVGQNSKKSFPPLIKFSPKARVEDANLLKNHPYGSVLKCLRQENSAAARMIPITGPDWFFLSESKINPVVYQLCQNDQVNESFADWLGIEAAVDSLHETQKNMTQEELENEYASVYSTKCNEKLPVTNQHPSLDRRANGILGVNPKVRELLKCNSKDQRNIYCVPPEKNATNSAQKAAKKIKTKGQN